MNWADSRAKPGLKSIYPAAVPVARTTPTGMLPFDSQGWGGAVFVGTEADRDVDIQTKRPSEIPSLVALCVTHNAEPLYLDQLEALRDVVGKLDRATLVVDDEATGRDWSIAEGRNRSIEKSDADHVMPVDCDFRITPEAWMAVLESYASSTHPIGGVQEFIPGAGFRRYLLSDRDAYRYDEGYKGTHYEDTDLYWRLSKNGFLINCIEHEGFMVEKHTRPMTFDMKPNLERLQKKFADEIGRM